MARDAGDRVQAVPGAGDMRAFFGSAEDQGSGQRSKTATALCAGTAAFGLMVLDPAPARAQDAANHVVTYLFSPFLLLLVVILPLKVLMMTEAMGAKLRYSLIPIVLATVVTVYLMVPMTAIGIAFRPDQAVIQMAIAAGALFLLSYVIDSLFLLVIAARVGIDRIAYASALANGIIFAALAGFVVTLYSVSRETFDFILFFGSMVLASVYGLSLPLFPGP